MKLEAKAPQKRDYIVKAIAGDGYIRAVAAVVTGAVEKARRIHDLSPAAAQALGRLLAAGALLVSTLKDRQTVTLRVISDGPIGGMVVVANSRGELRGYVKNSQVDLPVTEEAVVAQTVGKTGFLHITYDVGLKEPYTGLVPLVSSEIAEDLVYYFYHSEQIPSLVALGVYLMKSGVSAAGGIMIQMMPGADECGFPQQVEEISKSIPPISKMLHGNVTPEEIIELYIGKMRHRIIEKKHISFRCGCNRKRLTVLILGFGEKELLRLLGKYGKVEAQCHFCRKKYIYSRGDIVRLLARS